MNEAHVVKRLQGTAEVQRQSLRGATVERLGPRQHRAQATTLDELHHRKEPAGLGLTHLQHADQSRIGRRPGDERPGPALDRPCDAGYGGKPARQEPDRDSLRGNPVLGETHGPEGAGP